MMDRECFSKLWRETDPGAEQVEENFAYRAGEDEATVVSIRLDTFLAAEPKRDAVFEGPLPTEEEPMPELTDSMRKADRFTGGALSPRRTRSGEWEAWQRVKTREVLGEGRRARSGRGYTVFPACPKVNKDILEVCHRMLPFAYDERGLPPEHVRDLCSYLFTKVETLADGNYSTVFLAREAALYLRRLGTPVSVSERRLLPNNQKPKDQ